MKERGIIMQGESVLGILEGRKSQTRRLSGLEWVNKYPGNLMGECGLGKLGYRGLETSDYYLKPSCKKEFAKDPGLFHWFLGEQTEPREINPIPVKCPYGQPGNHLYVKETFCDLGAGDNRIIYKATFDDLTAEMMKQSGHGLPIWKPSIFMPRWASRITLEIVNIRVERVQDISEEDAIAEGIGYLFSEKDCLTTVGLIGTTPIDHGYRNYLWHGDYGSYGGGNKQTDSWPYQYSGYKTATGSYSSLWEKINAKRGYSWDVNPYCWVIEFRVLK
jgi:hypothetical protein